MRTPKAAFATIFSHPVIAGVTVTLFALALLALLTPPITFNDGLSNDGKRYADLTERLRGKADALAEAP
jgi:hypothetical protein